MMLPRLTIVLSLILAAGTQLPGLGSKAPDFVLTSLAGAPVRLSDQWRHGPVVLVIGRGYPGYQCPFCTTQFAELRSRAKHFEAAAARVLWVYPGPADDLIKHAREFVAGKDVPPSFTIVLDPDYRLTSTYELRWNAPSETAYPATFVIDRGGIIRYAHVSREHGGRAPVADILAALPKAK